MSKVCELSQLAARIPSGARVAVGGFQLSRVPVALLQAVGESHYRDLDVVSAPNPLGLAVLAAADAVRSADCGFIGAQYEHGFGVPAPVSSALRDGAFTLHQRDVYDTIADLRSATDDAPPVADFALLHAQRGDRHGNLDIDDPYIDPLLASAATNVFATVEEFVDTIDTPTIQGNLVTAIAMTPGGAAPGACYGHYGRDVEGIRRLTGISAKGDPTEDTETADIYIVNLARQVQDAEVVVTGLASAVFMLAIAVARATHAPAARYINCIGGVNPNIDRMYPTSVEPALLADCEDRLDLADIFDLARDGGVDTMFFGAAQISRSGDINLTRIGPADAPLVTLPGPAGSPSMRSYVRRVIVGVPRQTTRNLVDEVDVPTSRPGDRNQETVLITDRATWRLGADGFQPVLRAPGTHMQDLISSSGFSAPIEDAVEAVPPTDAELSALRSIDPAGDRYRLFPARRSTHTRTPASSKEVLHER